jgi:hypothetical protein
MKSATARSVPTFGIIGAIATAVYQLVKKYNCHYPGCWRVGNHQAAGGQFSLCYRHHPDYQGRKPTRPSNAAHEGPGDQAMAVIPGSADSAKRSMTTEAGATEFPTRRARIRSAAAARGIPLAAILTAVAVVALTSSPASSFTGCAMSSC